jgi:PhnB protein
LYGPSLSATMEPTLSPKLAPYIVAHDARGLIRFIEHAIGGRLSYEVTDGDGGIAHAEVRIADGFVMIGEQPNGRDPFPAMLHLYVEDSDAAYQRAREAGGIGVREPTDSPDGLRRGGVRDSWGNEWWFSSPVKPVGERRRASTQ